MKSFRSSIFRFGPWFTPYNVTIGGDNVICYRNNGLNYLYLSGNRTSLKMDLISEVQIIDNILWCDIIIYSMGGNPVVLKHFTMDDAIEIQNLIHK